MNQQIAQISSANISQVSMVEDVGFQSLVKNRSNRVEFMMSRLSVTVIACILVFSLQAKCGTQISINGTTTILSGAPLSGVVISLANAKLSTISGKNGTWSLTGEAISILRKSQLKTAITGKKQLLTDDGYLSLLIDGYDIHGKQKLKSSLVENVYNTNRTFGAAVDTITFKWNGQIRSKTLISSYSTGNIYTQIDTSSFWGEITDSRDGQIYKWVIVGNQTWLAENLNYQTNDSWCYNGMDDSCSKYGRLYSWADMLAIEKSCNVSICSTQVQAKTHDICPNGWHVPSIVEWNTLINYSGRDSAGVKLKSKSGWYSVPNGIDSYGFNVLPGGTRYGTTYQSVTYASYFWTKTELPSLSNFASYVWFGGSDSIISSGIAKAYGLSLRCLKGD